MAKKILIVDDEVNIVISIEFLMKQAGYEIEIARNGQEAMDKITSFQPDLILLDIMMPKINGYEVSRRVREDPNLENTKIVMLTAKGREVEVAKGMALGADAYVIKPFSTKELLATVKSILDEE